MKVFVASGHMIDAPNRTQPRFPAAKVEAVRSAIAAQLRGWEIAPGDLAFCGGASGTDILFAEECEKCGARLHICLAQEAEKFIAKSVQAAGENWVARFQDLQRHAKVEVLPENFSGTNIYERTNHWLLETACAAADSGNLYALLVWDQLPTGDGPGGTSDFAARARALDAHLAIINPLTIR